MLTVAVMLAAIQPSSPTAEFSEAELKHYFWVCDDNSAKQMLDDSDAAVCSQIFEELKNRVFQGDSRALFDWWRAERDKPRPEAPVPPR